MALGKPVIATRYSGNLDFMDDGNSFLVDSRLVPVPAGCEPYPAGSMWAEPDVAIASRLMRGVVDRPDTVATKAAQAASDIRTLHSPEARVPFVSHRLAEIARARAVPPEEPAPPRGIDKLAAQVAAEPGGLVPGSRLRRVARWAALRATRPHWWGQRVADEAVLQSLREAEEARRDDIGAVRETHRTELQAEVEPLKDRTAYLEAHVDNVRDDLLRVAAAADAARADLAARLDRLEEQSTRGTAGPRPRLAGSIDYPAEGELLPRGVVQLTGWAFSAPSPLSRVEVAVDGEVIGRARLGLSRRDVERAHPASAAAGAGFSRLVDLSGRPNDATEAVMSVTAVTVEGVRLSLPPVRARLAPFDSTKAATADSRVPTQVRRPPFVRTGTQGGDLRLLAFAHDLGTGGAQAFLLDLVGRMRDRPGFSCTVVSPSDGPLRARLEAVGVDVQVGPPCPVDGAGGYVERVEELAGWAATEGYTAVLANTILSFHGVDVADRLAIPSLWAIHESYAIHELGAVWFGGDLHPDVERRARQAFSRASLVAFDADATRRLYLPLGEPGRFVVVPNAVDLDGIDSFAAGFDRSAARTALGVARDERVVLCVGSIEPRKGQAVLARALKLLGSEYPEARVFLVGDLGGEYSGALKRYATASGLPGRLKVVPHTTDVMPWYGVADVFVCPSDNESLPGVVLEAAAMGVPVVASRLFGIPDVIEDGRSGYLCEPSDVLSLATALKRALRATEEERDAITASARHRVEQNHDAVRRAEQIWDLLDGLTIAKGMGSAAAG
jgi:D-inositol-3-phosphate glycosyltransferase